VIKFLRAREIVHFQRFGEAINTKLSSFDKLIDLAICRIMNH